MWHRELGRHLLGFSHPWRLLVGHPARHGLVRQEEAQSLLKIPLTEEAEAVTHLRESRAAHWHRIGLALSIFSILCAMGWLVS